MQQKGIVTRFSRIISIFVLLFCLSMPFCIAAEPNTDAAKDVANIEVQVDNAQQQQQTPKKSKEAKSVLDKFFHTMLLVISSSIAIFLLLLLYKKMSTHKTTPKRNIEIKKDLISPETIEEATKLFIEKF